ncbi:MAG: methyltransferase domain-containing protein [Phycisphaerales bacterium]|nr:methyltransferase domain-containing protein [Phycisphaerales bacterium]
MSTVVEKKQLFYDTIADTFDDVMNEYDVMRRLDVVFDEFLSKVDLNGRNVLDAGCGTGRFSERAVERGGRVTSLDIGARLLQRVRARCRAKPVCGDITRLSFPDDFFDVVISSECIEHTPSPQTAVMELLRVCRPGGHVVITCPNRFWKWSCIMANALGIRAYDGLENWPGWFQLRRWIKATGGKQIDSTGIHLFPFVVHRLNPLLRKLDRCGRWLGPIYVNQAVLIAKT